MADDITEFLARDRSRRGKLAPWLDKIIALRKAGASYRAVCRYLAEHGVSAEHYEVSRFMRRCGRGRRLTEPAAKPAAPQPPAPRQPADGIPTFDWKPRDHDRKLM